MLWSGGCLSSFFLVLFIAALAVHIDWTWKRKLAPRGRYYHRVELAVPSTVSGKIDLRTMKRKRTKRKAVREDRPKLLSRRESQVVELMGKGLE
jgi:hypothetical protein